MNEFTEKLRSYKDYSSARGAAEDAIDAAEQALGVSFAADFREYLLECGSACADGHIFTGIDTVAETTALWRERHPEIAEDMYAVEVFENDGIVAWQSGSGEVFLTRDGVSPRRFCGSLLEYLLLMER